MFVANSKNYYQKAVSPKVHTGTYLVVVNRTRQEAGVERIIFNATGNGNTWFFLHFICSLRKMNDSKYQSILIKHCNVIAQVLTTSRCISCRALGSVWFDGRWAVIRNPPLPPLLLEPLGKTTLSTTPTVSNQLILGSSGSTYRFVILCKSGGFWHISLWHNHQLIFSEFYLSLFQFLFDWNHWWYRTPFDRTRIVVPRDRIKRGCLYILFLSSFVSVNSVCVYLEKVFDTVLSPFMSRWTARWREKRDSSRLLLVVTTWTMRTASLIRLLNWRNTCR